MTNIQGRVARCHCGKTAPSRFDLPFFMAAADAERSCSGCGYWNAAHERGHRDTVDHVFDALPAAAVDVWYCGHNGWD